MKSLKLLFVVMLLLSTRITHAKDFGLGVILGDPTGLSIKKSIGGNQAVDGGLAYGSHELIIWGDYLKHYPGRLGNQNAFISSLSPYIGIGPVLAFGKKDRNHRFLDDDRDTFGLGARIPLGVEWLSKEIPIGVSLEVVPGVLIIPETDAFFQGGLAIRYYF